MQETAGMLEQQLAMMVIQKQQALMGTPGGMPRQTPPEGALSAQGVVPGVSG